VKCGAFASLPKKEQIMDISVDRRVSSHVMFQPEKHGKTRSFETVEIRQSPE
jgi:hypothetical protein